MVRLCIHWDEWPCHFPPLVAVCRDQGLALSILREPTWDLRTPTQHQRINDQFAELGANAISPLIYCGQRYSERKTSVERDVRAGGLAEKTILGGLRQGWIGRRGGPECLLAKREVGQKNGEHSQRSVVGVIRRCRRCRRRLCRGIVAWRRDDRDLS